jgi:glycosyltransferase involved in cell wall biosynthesis
MLCSNDGQTLSESLDSVLELSKYRRVEVVVVDNMSTDGSSEMLHRYRDAGSAKLIERSCSRGEGRQLAFEASSGDYVLGHMDCDDVFRAAGIDTLIAKYHIEFEGKALMTKKIGTYEASNITIAPRTLLSQLGGWRSLNWGEDWDLWARAASLGQYAFLPYPVDSRPHAAIRVRTERYSSPTHGFWTRVSKYGDAIRIGRSVFDPGEHVSAAQRVAFAIAKARVAIGGGSLAPVPNPDFNEETPM